MLVVVIDRENYGNRARWWRWTGIRVFRFKEPGNFHCGREQTKSVLSSCNLGFTSLGRQPERSKASGYIGVDSTCNFVPTLFFPPRAMSPHHLRREDTKLSEYQVGPSFCGRSFNFIPSAGFLQGSVTPSPDFPSIIPISNRATRLFRPPNWMKNKPYFWHPIIHPSFSSARVLFCSLHVLLDIMIIP